MFTINVNHKPEHFYIMVVAVANYNRYNTRDKLINQYLCQMPSWIHPDVKYWWPEWKIIRDTFAGEREVKSARQEYLPLLGCMEPEDYEEYLNLATFYNMVGVTVSSLLGTMFRRNPVIDNFPTKLQSGLKSISKDKLSLLLFMKQAAQEVLSVGRYGVLLDMDRGGVDDPYFAGYIAENILDWKTEEVNGRICPTRIVLRELRLSDDELTHTKVFYTSYRVLTLEFNEELGRLVYMQRLHFRFNADAELNENDTVIEFMPTMRGNPFDFIPFIFFGSFSNTPECNRPPMQDIARLNIAHYQNYASYESGLFYTGQPVYWATVNDGGEQTREYKLGPRMVWLLGANERAGLLEFNGQGLKFLENAIQVKEQQISTLGARLMGTQGQATSESDNQLKLKERNEQAMLLNISQALDEGFSMLLKWYAMWRDVRESEADEISVQINKDFLLDNIGARELRAVQSLYESGAIPIEVLYDHLRKAEVVPDYMNLEEFKELLDNMESFPNQPDVHAQSEGFPDRKTQLEEEEKERNRQLLSENPDLIGVRSVETPENEE